MPNKVRREISQDEVVRYKEMFNEIDKNKSGYIGMEEFKSSVLSRHLSSRQCTRVVKSLNIL